MSRKDYDRIADVLRKCNEAKCNHDELCRAFAILFAKSNLIFDYARFMKACGVAS